MISEQYEIIFSQLKKDSEKAVFAASMGTRYIGYGVITKPESNMPYFSELELAEEGMYLVPYAVLAAEFFNYLHNNGYPEIWMDTEIKDLGENLGFTLIDSHYGLEYPLFRFVHREPKTEK